MEAFEIIQGCLAKDLLKNGLIEEERRKVEEYRKISWMEETFMK